MNCLGGKAAALALLVLGCMLGCKEEPKCAEGEVCDEQIELPDLCNSRDEALNDPQCALTLGEARTAYLSFAGDQDWYSAAMPSNLDARSLVRVTGGYGAPNTAVNLSLNLLREDGQLSLARRIDSHGQGAPKPVDMVVPFTQSGARLLLLVSDEKTAFDVKSQYQVKVEVLQNPDANEPNDTTATAIPLAAQGAVLSGQQSGYLATDDDVDRFSFDVPGGRKIVHLRVTAPKLSPPPPFRLAYTLFDPTGKPISEGNVANEFLEVDLATARLSTAAGKYSVAIFGYKSPNTSTSLPGDLRLQYTVAVQVFDDVDATEPNDSVATPRVLSFGSPGTTQGATGRLSYVPDTDWFQINLPSQSAPTALHYRVTPGAGGGRFPPLAPIPDRQVRVFRPVTQGATLADQRLACKSTDAGVCPKGYEGSSIAQGLVESLCDAFDPPLCLYAERNEHPSFSNLRNLEGVVPVPANENVQLFIAVQDDGNNYADDREYTLTVRWLSDSDEAARAALPNETDSNAIPYSASFPAPSGGVSVSGTLLHGYGRVLDHNVNQGQGVRGPQDYDAVPTDQDRFEFTFGSVTPPEDRTWTLQWELQKLPDGGIPAELALDLEFCDGDSPDAGAGCVSVSRGLTLAYSKDPLAPWWSSAQSDRSVMWTRDTSGGSVTVTAEPAGCFCFEPRFVRGQRFFVKVGAVDRDSYEPLQYTLRTAYTDYPKSFTLDGGARSCPAPVPDGGGFAAGCRFTR